MDSRDALIDVATAMAIDLAGARLEFLADLVQSRAQRHGHSVEGVDSQPSSPRSRAISNWPPGARNRPSAGWVHRPCRAPPGAMEARVSSSMIIRRRGCDDVMVPLVATTQRPRAPGPLQPARRTCWERRPYGLCPPDVHVARLESSLTDSETVLR